MSLFVEMVHSLSPISISYDLTDEPRSHRICQYVSRSIASAAREWASEKPRACLANALMSSRWPTTKSELHPFKGDSLSVVECTRCCLLRTSSIQCHRDCRCLMCSIWRAQEKARNRTCMAWKYSFSAR